MPFVPDPQQPSPPAAPPGQPPAAGHFHPDPDQVIAQQTPKTASAQPWHTLKILGGGLVGALGEMTGDKPEEIAARNKKLGLDEPATSAFDQGVGFLGGLLAPSPGSIGKAGTLAAARVADKAAGTTVGQQTGSTVIQMIEKTLARLPGGGAITHAIRTQNERIGETSDSIIQNLSGGADTSATGAGRVLKSQLGAAAKRMKEEAGSHFDEVERLIPKETPVGVSNTLETLKKLTMPTAGAENVSQKLINQDIVAIKGALEKDLASSHLQAMPYNAVKELRTKIGLQIDWGPFSTDPKNGQLKLIYNSLTADMNIGAASVSPEAAASVQKANAAYAKSKEEQKILSSVLKKAGGPEKVFSSLMSGTKEGATTLKQVLTAIDEPSRQVLAASALQRMGRATAGVQDASGALFSADTFLTNWNKMAPEAREALFGSLPGNYSQSISQLTANVAGLKAYAKLLPNNSNTAQALLWGETGSALMAVMTGHYQIAAAAAGSVAGTYALSSALTNPQTAKWLAAETSKLLLNATKGTAGSRAIPLDQL